MEQTKTDDHLCVAAICHHHPFTRDTFVQTLNLKNWLKYHVWHQSQRTLAFFGVLTLVYGASRVRLRLLKPATQWFRKIWKETKETKDS
jgi:hypothetical protein